MRVRLPKSIAERLARIGRGPRRTRLLIAAIEAVRSGDPGARVALMRRALPHMSESAVAVEAPESAELEPLWRWLSAFARRACLRPDVLLAGALIEALEAQARTSRRRAAGLAALLLALSLLAFGLWLYL